MHNTSPVHTYIHTYVLPYCPIPLCSYSPIPLLYIYVGQYCCDKHSLGENYIHIHAETHMHCRLIQCIWMYVIWNETHLRCSCTSLWERIISESEASAVLCVCAAKTALCIYWYILKQIEFDYAKKKRWCVWHSIPQRRVSAVVSFSVRLMGSACQCVRSVYIMIWKISSASVSVISLGPLAAYPQHHRPRQAVPFHVDLNETRDTHTHKTQSHTRILTHTHIHTNIFSALCPFLCIRLSFFLSVSALPSPLSKVDVEALNVLDKVTNIHYVKTLACSWRACVFALAALCFLQKLSLPNVGIYFAKRA